MGIRTEPVGRSRFADSASTKFGFALIVYLKTVGGAIAEKHF
jgi:hypothetical protein